jgi:NADH dehydrogenase/NADH:ubiquinone oxidoreductase subunit G
MENYEAVFGNTAFTQDISGLGEAHTLDHQNVIYRLDREKPMSNTEVLVLGGAGRYSLEGLRMKARREARALAQDLEIEHGGAFRRSAENVKQLANTLNTIVAAYNELKRIRQKGGRGSRGITDEDANFIRECYGIAQRWTQRFSLIENNKTGN